MLPVLYRNGVVKKAKEDQRDEKTAVAGGMREEVERLYKVRMPEDLFQFWEFCKGLNADCPQDALKETIGLQLVGPFDILSKKHTCLSSSQPNFHLHWGHFYDPPEFQTIIQGSKDTQHLMGYFRDAPDALPVFIGENEAKKGCTITQMGDNIFAAVLLLLKKKRKERGHQMDEAALDSLEEDLKQEAERLGLPLKQKTKAMKQRERKVVTKTFHGAGIVVPVDKNYVGYRELPESDASLKKICKAIAEANDDAERIKAFTSIQEMITFVQFANSECDYGMGYELGIDLFCYGSHYFCKVIRQLLPMAYNLLKRSLFGEILEAHLTDRSQHNLDQLAVLIVHYRHSPSVFAHCSIGACEQQECRISPCARETRPAQHRHTTGHCRHEPHIPVYNHNMCRRFSPDN
ncbi:histone PARylation factor 1-like [Myxocyprinus asiaticus]|uniref:histone PARylation factor 1-like n=1 Tax=Myxocyprinus asiaticus TaxID=70543 RepID=UPI002223B04B|nr:histone PARylation factor 1-like [Myxocyprinus asiaticus]